MPLNSFSLFSNCIFWSGGGLLAGSYLPVVHSVSPNLCLLLSLEVLDDMYFMLLPGWHWMILDNIGSYWIILFHIGSYWTILDIRMTLYDIGYHWNSPPLSSVASARSRPHHRPSPSRLGFPSHCWYTGWHIHTGRHTGWHKLYKADQWLVRISEDF